MRSLTLDTVTALNSAAAGASGHIRSDTGVLPQPRAGRDRRVQDRGLVPPREERHDAAAGASDEIKDLVLRARDGEPEAFGALYDKYVDLVYRFIYCRVGAHALAEDLTSETFLRALRRIAVFTWQGKDFGAWLVTIARNLIADHFKSCRHRLEVSTAEFDETDGQNAGWSRGDDALGPERAVLDSITARTLLEAVRELGSEQQECIVLRFLHGLSVAETALIMGKNTGAIKALQYRAVRALARLLPNDIR